MFGFGGDYKVGNQKCKSNKSLMQLADTNIIDDGHSWIHHSKKIR